MDIIFLALLIVAAAAASVGYRVGWNKCVDLYRSRGIDAANSRAEQDRL
jgi:hypothetical protein